jgi:MoaA/NifB/PqqE/SkfB family radical SAM enzyme
MPESSTLPKHLTTGGPGDKFLGGGNVDTSEWFQTVHPLDKQIKNQEIWFCGAPFQMLYTDTLGNFLPCSWADGIIGPNIKDTSIKEWFINDPKLNQLREEMTTPNSDLTLAKQWCGNCIKQEKQYGRSRRQSSLKIQTNDRTSDGGIWYGIRRAVENFKKTGKGSIDQRIFEIQIKVFGNKCNLDCYMCMPYDSSTKATTMESVVMKDQKIFGDLTMEASRNIKSIETEFSLDVIDQIIEIAPYIYNLKLIGGEPLVMKDYYRLLQRITDSGYANRMKVKYQTNMSVLELDRLKIMDFVPKFELFEFTVSLDSIGTANNYIRRRSHWDDIVNNIKAVTKYPNVKVNVNGTISFLSVLRFYELIDWFDSNVVNFKLTQINWSNIRNPELLCANMLPEEIKNDLIPKYERFPDIQNVLKEGHGNLDYQDTFEYLLMNDKYYKDTKWEMQLFDVFPELEKFYKPKIESKT